MRSTRIGGFLLGIGVVVGVVAVIGLAVGFEPARLPPALLNIAAYKLTFVAAAGLLAAGAVIRRYGKRGDLEQRSKHAADSAPPPRSTALPPPAAPEFAPRAEQPSVAEVPSRRER